MADNSYKPSIFDNQNSSQQSEKEFDESGNTIKSNFSFSQKMKDTFSSANQTPQNSSSSLVNLLFAIGIWIFVALLAISFVSFIYTGEADQSLVLGFFSDTPTQKIPQNWLGMFGAIFSHFLIERWFGIGAFLLLVIGATSGLVLIGKYALNKWKELSISLFFVIFVMSMILGYLVYMTETQTAWAFLCGGIGYAVSALFGQIFTPVFIIAVLVGFGYFFGKDRLNIEFYTNFSPKRDSNKKTQQPTETQKTTSQNPVPSAHITEFKEVEAANIKDEIENTTDTNQNKQTTESSLSLKVDENKEKVTQETKNQPKKQSFFDKLFSQNTEQDSKQKKSEENTTENPFDSKTKIKDSFNRQLPQKEVTNQQFGKQEEKNTKEQPSNDLRSEIEKAREEANTKNKFNKKDGKREEDQKDKDGFFIPSARDFGISTDDKKVKNDQKTQENNDQEEHNPFAIHIPSTKMQKEDEKEEIKNSLEDKPKNIVNQKIEEDQPKEEKQDELDYDLPMPPSVSRVRDLYGENVEELIEEENGKPIYAGITPYNPNDELPKYESPPTDLLDNPVVKKHQIDKEELTETKLRIEQTLKNFKIDIKRIHAEVGPTVTLYEIVPAPGVKIAQIRNLGDDIALNLSALGIRIIAPMPGKGTIGIEVPNKDREIVPLRMLLEHESFKHSRKELPLVLGKDISNQIFIADLTKMPHLLIGGATGQGKSVGINVILTSLIYKKHPSELKFVMIDPKKVEFSLFSKLEKHYLAHLPGAEPIVTDSVDAVKTLEALCREMDQRYDLLKDGDCRNIKEYNHKFKTHQLLDEQHRYLPYIVLVIDELADLMIIAGKAAEKPIARLAQMARAIGIHLVVATQRPSVNVVTGIIKANFPARMAFRVTSKIDSRIILDTGGAEQLVGQGDMLLSNGSDILRLQCAFVDTPEVERICKHIQDQKGFFAAYPLPEENNFNVEDDEYLAGDELF